MAMKASVGAATSTSAPAPRSAPRTAGAGRAQARDEVGERRARRPGRPSTSAMGSRSMLRGQPRHEPGRYREPRVVQEPPGEHPRRVVGEQVAGDEEQQPGDDRRIQRKPVRPYCAPFLLGRDHAGAAGADDAPRRPEDAEQPAAGGTTEVRAGGTWRRGDAGGRGAEEDFTMGSPVGGPQEKPRASVRPRDPIGQGAVGRRGRDAALTAPGRAGSRPACPRPGRRAPTLEGADHQRHAEGTHQAPGEERAQRQAPAEGQRRRCSGSAP